MDMDTLPSLLRPSCTPALMWRYGVPVVALGFRSPFAMCARRRVSAHVWWSSYPLTRVKADVMSEELFERSQLRVSGFKIQDSRFKIQ